MADPTPVEVAGGLSTSATTTVNFTARPAGTLLLLSAACDDYRVASGAGTPENTGWALLDARQGNLGCYVWWKIATGSEIAVQYRIGSNSRSAYTLVALDNIAVSPLGVQNGNASAITTSLARPQAVAAVTPAAGERWCVVAVAGTTGNVNGGPYTWTGYTKTSERYNTAGYRPGVTVAAISVDGGSVVNGTVNFTATTEQFMSIVAAWKVAPATGGGSTTGSGAATAPAATAAGTGSAQAGGAAAAAAPAGAATGSGSATATGSGTAVAAAGAASGTSSAPTVTGSGVAAAATGTAGGAGTASAAGSGSAAGPASAASGAGAARATAAGAATAAPGTAAGSGSARATGSGGATAPASTASGTSQEVAAAGPGAANAAAGTASGGGTTTSSGPGHALATAATADGTGAASTTGIGSAAAPSAAVVGSASVVDPDALPDLVATIRPSRFFAGPMRAPAVTVSRPGGRPRFTVSGFKPARYSPGRPR